MADTATLATPVSVAPVPAAQLPAVIPEDTPAKPQTTLERLAANHSTVPLLIVSAAFLAVIIAAALWATNTNYQLLYSNLSDAEGGELIAALDQRGIDYKISQGGGAILVPAEHVYRLRMELAEQGLPRSGKVGFELMDNQAFGISKFAEQVNFQRGLEGELAQSIEQLSPVKSARIHLAMARRSVFVSQNQPAKASAVLNLHAGRTMTESQVNAIALMIASAVADLEAEDVSVVDQRGELLSAPKDDIEGLKHTQLEYTHTVESSYQQRVQNILEPILGAGSFKVQVSASLDFTRVEETTEAWSPNKSSDSASIRSSQTRTNFSGNEDAARGVPGALSNIAPTFEPPIAEQRDPDAADGQALGEAAAGRNTNKSNLSRDDIVNYELDRAVRHIEHPRGSLERLSVAVVVDHRQSINDQGEQTNEPLSEAELTNITRLIQQAVGFTPERGDSVEVVNSAFKVVKVPVVEEAPWWREPAHLDMLAGFLRYLVAGIMIALSYRLIVRPVMKKHLIEATPETTPALAEGGALNKIEGGVGDDTTDPAASIPFKRVDRSASYAEQLRELQRLGGEDPKMIAMIVRNWMKHDSN
ncbi:hypothetical protein A3709_07600 [Halioglobus sp. HI00S01]|uniref:flagellar basal-body MS-ring/collar protein FliF n=1 Tax=Halioglobus sp. HI00S01 TaxID=1822214 RepID=UPI0007C24CCA|nr:flagellar basal-body MS-ring/collar protein FliF [Halioglobus sp. HI00S01]KZX54881.1 hypothetical protein A3709_07600 [Halioglobus sp. HI00S01]